MRTAENVEATIRGPNDGDGDSRSASPSPSPSSSPGERTDDDDKVDLRRGRLDVISRALLERSSLSSSSSSRKSGPYDSSEASSSSSSNLSAARSDGGGTFSVANRPLGTGDLVLECESACGVALDAEHRRSKCGFCAARVMSVEAEAGHMVAGTICGDDDQPCPSSGSSSLSSRVAALCGGCRIVSTCIRCREAGASRWHVESGECRALAALVRCFGKVFLLENLDSESRRTKVDDADADEVDSTYVLAVRLLFRRWSDEGGSRTKDEKTEKCSDPSPPCPLPPVDWTLFDVLHATKLTPDDDDDEVANDGDGELTLEQEKAKAYGVAMDRLCRLMREDYASGGGGTGGDTDAGASPGWIDRGAFDEVMGRVVGCSHAVTDVTLDLGCQCLGRALFLHHSFYNHACAPNAFLSCFIVDGDRKDDREGLEVEHRRGNCFPTSSPKDSHTRDGSLLSTKEHQTTTVGRDQLGLSPARNESKDAAMVAADHIHDGEPVKKKRRRKLPPHRQHHCALIARVHCLRPIRQGEAVTLSYIPTSGLDRAERRRLLRTGYRFHCRCSACSFDEPASAGKEDEDQDAVDVAAGWERALRVPQCDAEGDGSGGIDALREVQHSCNRALLRIRHGLRMMRGVPPATDGRRDDDEALTVDLANCLATLRMTANGVRNQRLPSSHEVSVESHRLLATGLSLSAYASAADCDDDDDYDDDGRRRLVEEAIVEHERFLRAVEPIRGLFDPVAVATQRVALAADLRLAGACSVGTIGTVDGETTTNDRVDRGATKWRKQLDLAFEGARNALGFDHPFVLSILRKKNLL